MSHLHTANSIRVLHKLYTEHTGWSQIGGSHLSWIIPAKQMPQSSQFLNYKCELSINIADTYLQIPGFLGGTSAGMENTIVGWIIE